MLLKFLDNLITTPSYPPSVNKVLEPAPSTKIFSSLFILLIKLIRLFNVSALKKSFVFPPILNQFFFLYHDQLLNFL